MSVGGEPPANPNKMTADAGEVGARLRVLAVVHA